MKPIHCLVLLALLVTAGCNWELPPQKPKPDPLPVTGPFSLYFPDTSVKAAAQPPSVKKPADMQQAFQHKPSVKVGVLLPLSGESQKLGQSLLDAAQLALYDTYVGLSVEEVAATVTLIPRDTQASPTVALASAKELISQGAKVIIGPLYSQSAESVGALSKAHGVPVIAFSNNETVAKSGAAIFGPTPEQQIVRITQYALAQSIETFALLAPNDAYGRTVLDTLKRELELKGGKLLYVERYGRNDGARSAASTRLSAAMQKSNVQALLIADTSAAAALMVEGLKTSGANLSEVQLFGSGQWAESEQSYPAALENAMFPALSDSAYERFRQRYQAAYGSQPERLSELAYDLTTLVASRVASGKPLDSNGLLGAQMTIGPATGGYRFRSDGVAERAYGIMQIRNGKIAVVSPAPKLF